MVSEEAVDDEQSEPMATLAEPSPAIHWLGSLLPSTCMLTYKLFCPLSLMAMQVWVRGSAGNLRQPAHKSVCCFIC